MLGASIGVGEYMERLKTELDRVDPAEIRRWGELLYEAWRDGRFVFLFGNGGSACTASHLAEDLGKNCISSTDDRDETARRLKVLSLTDNVGWITAVANDISYEEVFSQQLIQYGKPGDLVIAISGSGNSPNVLKAVDWANRHGLITFGVTGYDGGKLKKMQKEGLHVPLTDMGMVESVHMCVVHWVVDDLYARINRCGRYAA